MENDVKSVFSAYYLRSGKYIQYIEKCSTIFITTNVKLPVFASKIIKDADNNPKNIPVAITDLDMSTLLWIKNYKGTSKIPILKLIENAVISMQPSEEIKREFFKQIDILHETNSIGKEELSAYRLLIHNQKEKIMEATKGDPAKINNITCQDLNQMAEDYYSNKTNEKNKILNKEIQRMNNENIKLKQELEENKLKEKEIFENIQNKITISKKRFSKIMKIIVFSIIGLILLAGTLLSIESFYNSSEISVSGIVLLILGLYGMVDSISSKLKTF